MNSGRSELFLQIICEIQIDRGSKWDLLGGGRTHSLPDIRAAQGLRRPAIFDHKLERRIFIGDDLLVLQQLEKPVVGDVLDRLHSSPVKEHCERNKPKGDRDENDPAPVKIGFAPAGFILLLRVAIGLSHKRSGILRT